MQLEKTGCINIDPLFHCAFPSLSVYHYYLQQLARSYRNDVVSLLHALYFLHTASANSNGATAQIIPNTRKVDKGNLKWTFNCTSTTTNAHLRTQADKEIHTSDERAVACPYLLVWIDINIQIQQQFAKGATQRRWKRGVLHTRKDKFIREHLSHHLYWYSNED